MRRRSVCIYSGGGRDRTSARVRTVRVAGVSIRRDLATVKGYRAMRIQLVLGQLVTFDRKDEIDS